MFGSFDNFRIGRVDSIYVSENLTALGIQGCSQGNRSRVGPAPAQSSNLPLEGHSLKAGHNNNATAS